MKNLVSFHADVNETQFAVIMRITTIPIVEVKNLADSWQN